MREIGYCATVPSSPHLQRLQLPNRMHVSDYVGCHIDLSYRITFYQEHGGQEEWWPMITISDIKLPGEKRKEPT